MFPFLAVIYCITTVHCLILPVTKPDGSLDVSSLLSHLALLEQIMESKASTTETADLRSQLKTALADLKTSQVEIAILQSQLKSGNAQCSCNSSSTATRASAEISGLKADVSTLKTEVFQLQSQRNATQAAASASNGGGATFTRWGRTSCPNDTRSIYKGYTGGSMNHGSGSATILCLPEHPLYSAHTSLSSYYATIYGTEYETASVHNPFNSFHNEDLPCVVCESVTKRSAIMVPARNQCYPGWNTEYSGYLMKAAYNLGSGEHVCVDQDPEAIPGGHDDKVSALLLMVMSVCGSLPCPPYQNNWVVTCAVCSK